MLLILIGAAINPVGALQALVLSLCQAVVADYHPIELMLQQLL